MKSQQSSNLTNWIISFFLETDPNPELQEFSTPAATRKDAYLAFWAIHDNPDIIVASCMQEGKTPRPRFMRSAAELTESVLLPTQVHTEDDMLIRAIYGIAALWVQDGEHTLNSLSQCIHLIAQHSMRMTLTTGEHPTPQADAEMYTYLRDAAMFFDFVANGDNAVMTEEFVFTTAHPYFSDLLNS